MMDKTIELNAKQLAAKHGMSPDRAEAKAEGTVVGKLGAVVGLFLMVSPLGLGALIVASGGKLAIPVVVLLLALLGLGFVLFGLSVSLISRDAAPMVAAAGELLLKLARIARGKKGNGNGR